MSESEILCVEVPAHVAAMLRAEALAKSAASGTCVSAADIALVVLCAHLEPDGAPSVLSARWLGPDRHGSGTVVYMEDRRMPLSGG